MAVGRFFFSAAPTAKNSPEFHFRFINFSIHPSRVGSLDGSISQAGLSHQNVAPTFLRNADGSISQTGFHQNVAPTATFLRNADGTISQVANFNQFQGLQTVPLNSGFLRAFPNQHFAGQHLIQHAY